MRASREDPNDACEVFRDAMTLANVYLMRDDPKAAHCCVQLLTCCLQLYGLEVCYGFEEAPAADFGTAKGFLDLSNSNLYDQPDQIANLCSLLIRKPYDGWFGFDLLVRLAIELDLIDQIRAACLAHYLAKEAVERCAQVSLETLQNFIEWSTFFITAQSEREPDVAMVLENIRWCRAQVRERDPDGDPDEHHWDNVLRPLYDLLGDGPSGKEAYLETSEFALDEAIQDSADSETGSSELVDEPLLESCVINDDCQDIDSLKPDGIYRSQYSSSTVDLTAPLASGSAKSKYNHNEISIVSQPARNRKKAGVIRRTSDAMRRSLSGRKLRKQQSAEVKPHRPAEPEYINILTDSYSSILRQKDSSSNLRSVRLVAQEDPQEHVKGPEARQYYYEEKEIVQVAHSFQLYKRHRIRPEPRPLPDWPDDNGDDGGEQEDEDRNTHKPGLTQEPFPPITEILKKEKVGRRRLRKKKGPHTLFT